MSVVSVDRAAVSTSYPPHIKITILLLPGKVIKTSLLRLAQLS